MKSTGKTRSMAKSSPLVDLESQLSEFFTPVEPRQSYISELKLRLNRINLKRRLRMSRMHMVILAVASLVSGITLIVMGLRVFVALLSALGLLKYARDQAEVRRNTPIQPAM